MGKYLGSDGLSAIAAEAKQRDITNMAIDGTTLTLTKGDGSTMTATIPQKTYSAGTGISISNTNEISITGTPLNYKGSCKASELPSASNAKIGDMWNITDSSTYGPAGTNVAWNGTVWDPMGGTVDIPIESISGTAPISSTMNGTTATISIAEATQSAAGSMSAADKSKLDKIAAGAQVNVIESISYTAPITASKTNKVVTIGVSEATTAASGVMSASDKVKLNGIESNANNYVLPQATDTELGGVKVDGSTITINNTTGQISAVSQNAFGYVKVGNATISADTGADTLEFSAGTGITLTPDATNDKITIAASNNGTITGVTAGTNLTGGGTTGSVTINHAASGVTANTYGVVATTALTPGFGATFSVPGVTVDAQGHITAAGSHTVKMPNSTASGSANGLMTSAHYTKLEGIATGATADTEMTAAEAETIWDAA